MIKSFWQPWSYNRIKVAYNQGCRSLLSIGGDNLQFYPNFALFSTLGGMNLDYDFFQVSKLSKDQKEGLPNMEHFFSRFQGETCAHRRVARNSQWGSYLGGLAAGGNSGLGTEPPALENFAFFCKNNLILELF